jgi:hypothetical protein
MYPSNRMRTSSRETHLCIKLLRTASWITLNKTCHRTRSCVSALPFPVSDSVRSRTMLERLKRQLYNSCFKLLEGPQANSACLICFVPLLYLREQICIRACSHSPGGWRCLRKSGQARRSPSRGHRRGGVAGHERRTGKSLNKRAIRAIPGRFEQGRESYRENRWE